jgi:hypothetical protein
MKFGGLKKARPFVVISQTDRQLLKKIDFLYNLIFIIIKSAPILNPSVVYGMCMCLVWADRCFWNRV